MPRRFARAAPCIRATSHVRLWHRCGGGPGRVSRIRCRNSGKPAWRGDGALGLDAALVEVADRQARTARVAALADFGQ